MSTIRVVQASKSKFFTKSTNNTILYPNTKRNGPFVTGNGQSFRKSSSDKEESGNKTKRTVSTAHYCMERVRQFDHDHYLCGLLIKNKASREAYFAIRAWNVELATIREVTKDNTIAQMRVQWWKEAMKDIYKNNPPQQPVAKALAVAVQNFGLTKGWFNKIMERRQKDAVDEPLRTMDDMEAYSEETSSALLYLALECNGIKNINADHAASHIGKALGISILLRSTAYHSTKNHCYLPLNLLAKHGVSQEDLYRGEGMNTETQCGKGLIEVAYEASSVANSHLEQARALKDTIPKEAFPALLSATIADDFLKRLQKRNFYLYDPSLTRKHALMAWKLKWNELRGKF